MPFNPMELYGIEGRQLDNKYVGNMLQLGRNDPFGFMLRGGMGMPGMGYPGMGYGGMGMSGMMGPIMSMMDPSSQYGQNSLRMQNLQNPNQIQGSMQNLGLNIGSALRNRAAPPMSPQQDQDGSSGQDPLSDEVSKFMMKSQYYSSETGGAMPKGLAIEKALQESRLPPEIQSQILERNREMPRNYLAGPVKTSVALARGYDKPIAPHMYLVQDKDGQFEQKPINKMETKQLTDGPDGHVGTYHIDEAGNTYNAKMQLVDGPGGNLVRLTGEVGNLPKDQAITRMAEDLAATKTFVQTADALKANIQKTGIAGGLPQKIVEGATNVTGFVNFMRQQAVNSDNVNAISDADLTKSLNARGITDARSQSFLIALGYLQARLDSPKEQRVPKDEMIRRVEQLGGDYHNPAAMANALDAAVEQNHRALINNHDVGPINSVSDTEPRKRQVEANYQEYKRQYIDPRTPPPPTTSKTYTQARLQAYAEANFGGDLAAAEAHLKASKWTRAKE